MAAFLAFLDNLRLQTRISLLVAFGLVIVLGLQALSSLKAVQETTDRIVQERLMAAEMTANYVDTILGEALAQLANATRFASFDPERSDLAEERHLLVHTYGQRGDFAQGLLLLDRHGDVVLAQPPTAASLGGEPTLRPTIARALQTGERSVSNAFLDHATNRPTAGVVFPVRNERGEIVSLLVGLLDLSGPQFASSLSFVTHLGKTGHADLVDANLNVVVSSDADHVLEQGEHLDFYRKMLQGERSGVETTAYVEKGEVKENHLMAFVPLRTMPWGIGLGSTNTETFAPVYRLQREAGLLAALSLAAALIFVWLTTRRVVRPVETLTVAAERMAAGDLAAAISVRGGDEVGRLAATFENMRLKLLAAHQDLTFEKSRYLGIIRAMADPVFTVDTRLRITAFNPAAERMTGWSAAEALGRCCSEVLRQRGHDGAEEKMPSCHPSCPLVTGAACGRMPAASTEVAITRQGCEVPVEATKAPIFDDDGHLVGVVHVLRDVSAQAELDRLKEQFLSNVSHELRSPLGHIKGYATTLLRRDAQWDQRTQQSFLGEILHGSERLQRLVDELLDSSRLQNGRFTVEQQPAWLGQIARAAVRWVRPQTSKHKFVVSVPRAVPRVLADPQRTEQVLRNLLENAVKYSPQGGCITVQGQVKGAEVIVSVADEGIGIAATQLERIFERFHRVDNPLAYQAAGVGLGLSICRGIVEAQGGRIWAESQPGQGSVFYFSLPIFVRQAEAASRRAARRGRRAAGSISLSLAQREGGGEGVTPAPGAGHPHPNPLPQGEGAFPSPSAEGEG